MQRSSSLVSLFIATLALTGSGSLSAQGPTNVAPAPRPSPFVFVDEDFGPSTHGWQISRFDSIQDGVDAVAVGGTVFVQAGVYVEDVVIDKRLVLRGEADHAATVQGAGGVSVFTVTADRVTIQGFHISHSYPERTLTLLSSFNTFRDNVMSVSGDIRIEDEANDNIIANNDLFGFLSIGSYPNGAGSHRNLIEGNNLGPGAVAGRSCMVLARSTQNLIRDNTIDSLDRGIRLYYSEDNEISNNVVQSRYRGIQLSDSHRNTILANSLSGILYDGIRIADSDSCSITGNTLSSLSRFTGVHLIYSDDAYLANNVFLGADGLGISVYQCSNATILDNLLASTGISLSTYAEGRQYWDSHQIAGNTLAGEPIYYFVDTADLVVPPDAAQVILVGCDRASVSGLELSNLEHGIQLAYCSEGVIAGNELFSSGIFAHWSDTLTIRENVFLGNRMETAIDVGGTGHFLTANVIEAAFQGISLRCADTTVTRNDIRFCDEALVFGEAYGVGTVPRIPTANEVSSNTLFGNTRGIFVQGNTNVIEGNRIEASLEYGVRFVDRDEDALDATSNTLIGNVIVGNGVGVWIDGEATANTIVENGIAGNDVGVNAPASFTTGNRIYHNDLVNMQNAFDAGTNAWDDGSPSGGNYWDDYAGVDLDADGLGDTPQLVSGGGNQDGYPLMDLRGPGALWAVAPTLSAQTGGTVSFELHAGSKHAGRSYLLLGSITGTEPGIPLPGGEILPLVRDSFTDLVLANLNTPIFTDFRGTLDAAGSGTASWNVAPFDPALAGLRVYFAYTLEAPWDLVSWPISIAIVE